MISAIFEAAAMYVTVKDPLIYVYHAVKTNIDATLCAAGILRSQLAEASETITRINEKLEQTGKEDQSPPNEALSSLPPDVKGLDEVTVQPSTTIH